MSQIIVVPAKAGTQGLNGIARVARDYMYYLDSRFRGNDNSLYGQRVGRNSAAYCAGCEPRADAASGGLRRCATNPPYEQKNKARL